jgi:integrase
MQLNAISTPDVSKVHREVARSGRKGKRREGMANRMLTTLSSIFSFAIHEQILPTGSNPVPDVGRYKESFTARYFNSDELTRIGEALREGETVGIPWDVPDDPNKLRHYPKEENRRTYIDPFAAAAIRLLILTGARTGEILGLRWEYVDLERGVLLLPDSKTGQKTIVLSYATLDLLATLPRVGPYVLPGPSGNQPLRSIRGPYLAVLKRAGLKARPHDLRHTHASLGVAAGLSLQVVGKLLGHNSTKTTERYGHLEIDPIRRGADQIGSLLQRTGITGVPGVIPAGMRADSPDESQER